MNNDDKMLKILGTVVDKLDQLQVIQQEQGKDIQSLKEGQTHTNSELTHIRTVLKVVATRGDVEATVDQAKAELKVDLQDVKATLVKKVQSHERRISALEDELNIPHPEKH